MAPEQLLMGLGLYTGTLVLGFITGAIPFVINLEIFLLGVAAFTTRPLALWWVATLATVGQMTAKLMLYGSGRGSLKLLRFRPRDGRRVDQLRDRLVRARSSRWLFFTSAVLGLPPIYFMSIACGLIGMNVWQFLGLGILGRMVRFASLLFLPQLIRHYW